MSTYVVAADNYSNGNHATEKGWIDTVIKKLEAKGHTCENAGVGPNTIQSYGLSSKASGKIGVFIVNGSDAGMFVDFVTGLKNGYYHYKYMWVVFASNTATTDKWLTCNGIANTPLVRAHDDNYSGSTIESVGQTAKAYFEANKQYINYVCGKLGCSFDEIATKLANGGSDDDGESSASSIKEALRDVLSPLDGEVECKVINDKVFVNKIPEPESSYNLELLEGINVIYDSISITDYNPNTINKLIVHWNNGEDIVYMNDELIDRFGEKVSELDAVKTITITETDESSGESSSSEIDSNADDSISTESKTTTSTKEVPVETYEEALNFAKTEWAKIRRENGHTIECRVNASPKWRQGEWVKVYIPSFDEDCFMYITKVSQSNSPNNSQCSLTLTDYPPSLGEPKENSDDDSEENEEETSEEELE
ncbi:MAG: hypothetical protein IJQ68_10325 [Methanobrevibacter sp.]|uniref:hypothetical protein n=1 Tax=Methanobrevibacter sp. TaxID=66852 RepID=UPI0025E8ABAA|nr:hypothetical protein [Methanobrevibacter sp.]MBR0272362.1 hypothetical protein [Methanobrevibacter sp.]